MNTKALSLIGLSIACLILSCSDETGSPVQPRSPFPASMQSPKSGTDGLFLGLTEKVPFFGGFYLDGEDLVIHITDLNKADVVGQVVESALSKRSDVAYKHARYVRSNYAFSDLYDWRQLLLAGPEIVLADVDEKENKVRLGVLNQTDRSSVLARVALTDIPEDAVVVDIVSRPSELVSLGSRTRPVKGGLEIDGPDVGLCSTGFIARSNGTKVLVTAAHCTPTVGYNDSASFHQNTNDSQDFIGSESLDPAFSYLSGCVQPCRKSDAVLVEIASGVVDSVEVGQIYRTNGPDTGSVDIVGNFAIDGEIDPPFVGQVLSKVGRSTGWTTGEVEATCVTITNFRQGKDLDCQHRLDIYAGTGDSGSPVFKKFGANHVFLYGILWGAYFSPISGIESDLGALSTTFENCPPDLIC